MREYRSYGVVLELCKCHHQLLSTTVYQYAQHAKILTDRDTFAIGDLDAGLSSNCRAEIPDRYRLNPAFLVWGFADAAAYYRHVNFVD